jgi:hypothetical protein
VHLECGGCHREIRQFRRPSANSVVLCGVVRTLTPRPTSQLRRPVSSSPTNVIPNREVARMRMDNGNMRGRGGGGLLVDGLLSYLLHRSLFVTTNLHPLCLGGKGYVDISWSSLASVSGYFTIQKDTFNGPAWRETSGIITHNTSVEIFTVLKTSSLMCPMLFEE